MISSLPKTLQNDFDTIVIDILSRYSLDNKSVQKFVQTISKQVRNVRQLPRSLQPTKPGSSRAPTENKETKEASGRPNFITRLENLQNTFNKGGLLGVFFEYLKNRQSDAKAKIVPTEKINSEQNKKTKEEANNIQTNKQVSTVIEKTDTKFEKLQEAFDGKGLISIAQSILKELQKRSNKATETSKKVNTPSQKNTTIPSTYNKKYNIDSQTNETNNSIITPQSTNYSTIKADNTQTTYTGAINSTNINSSSSQAQAQDLLTDEINVVLGGINDYGERDLKAILESVLEDVMPKEKPKSTKKSDTTPSSTNGDNAWFGGLFGLMADLGRMGGLLKGMVPMLSKFGSALGVAGAAVAGNYIGGKVGEMIGSDEQFSEYWYGSKTAGKEAYEKYGTGVEGFTSASYDYLFGEGKQLREGEKEGKVREEKMKVDALERSKKSLEGTPASKNIETYKKTREDLKKQLQEAQETERQSKEKYEETQKGSLEGWNPFHDETAETDARRNYEARQTTVKQMQNSLVELEKVNPDKPSTPSAPNINNSSSSTINNAVTVPEVQDALIKPDGGLLISSPKEGSLFQLSKNDGIAAGPMTETLSPQNIKPTSSMPPSVTETHVTNNNMNNKALEDIVHNTEKTNKTLLSLSESIFKLAKNINTNNQANNTVLVNNGQQTQAYTSTAQIAANNVDSIRLVRQQFLAATV